MNDWLDSYRLTVFVPLNALDTFVAAVSPHIPAFLGNYDHVCWWNKNGIEQSRKIEGGSLKREACARFECSLPRDKLALERFVQQIIIPAHPWEEPVILIHENEIRRPGKKA